MFGVCYYPEHWPESMWAQDAAEMAALGLQYVRIAEFAWSKMEPAPGFYQFDWLDKAITTLADAGLKVVLCTPTATPPKWLVDLYPTVLPVDVKTGQRRGFGSRRHYDFSSHDYQREAMRITEVMARRYGSHPAVVGWQTDNEIGCHDTTPSASDSARAGFIDWCRQRYGTVDALNQAWGTIFWSMEYQDFGQIELPVLAVTETNPAHQLAFRRYCSEQVVRFHNQMVACIRAHAPGRFVTHNFIPMTDTQTDNYALAAPLDFASFDNYPLGRSDLFFADESAETFKSYMRTGHPDFSSYYFDQTRGLTGQHFWIMEQQPGPVNWAWHNPRPAPGMVRFWSWVAFAHGADVVSYFRWRQAPFAQEQMHAGLKRVDNSPATAYNEIATLVAELQEQPALLAGKVRPKVALISSTTNQWICEIERQGNSFNQQKVEFAWYSALRRLGVDVDFIAPVVQDLSPYQLILAPCLPIVSAAFTACLAQSPALKVFGVRSGSKTDEFSLAPQLAPGLLQQLIPVKVLSVETIRPDCAELLHFAGKTYQSHTWREELAVNSPDCQVLASYHDGLPAIVRQQQSVYVGTHSCDALLEDLLASLCQSAAVTLHRLPPQVRLARRGTLVFLFNYNEHSVTLDLPAHWQPILGQTPLEGHQVLICRDLQH